MSGPRRRPHKLPGPFVTHGGFGRTTHANCSPIIPARFNTDLLDPSGLSAYLYCEQIPTTRGGGLLGAAGLALSAARHCYIRVTCPGKYDVTLEMYGPQPGAPNGRPMMGVPNPARNADATVNPIYPRQPNPDGCCRFENDLIKQFNLHQPPPPYNPRGPNSNTFAAEIIRAAGGLAVFPPSAIGADYNNR